MRARLADGTTVTRRPRLRANASWWLALFAFSFGLQSSRDLGAKTSEKCAADMVLIDGQYCPVVEQQCLRWLDDPKLPFARCAVYAKPSRCLATPKPMRFCIDRYEYTPPTARLPLNFASFAKVSVVCARLGKRICSEEEWNFACEGETMQPYPYGFERRAVCNQDRYDLYEDEHRTVLRDLREPSTARPACVSPFGVFNMTGNMDEPVRRLGGTVPFSNSLKGGWWMPSQNRCRFATTAHDDYYQGVQVGARCCSDLDAGP
ncbi:MAG TPA: SUMF1/EgtB/PvdO family nonheme iron enzyme [Polyangiaceae bacterium]|nr:SUMF1/EgtB/PvdO family nonheme iron enzyme [Polyangiaceae bacterium]